MNSHRPSPNKVFGLTISLRQARTWRGGAWVDLPCDFIFAEWRGELTRIGQCWRVGKAATFFHLRKEFRAPIFRVVCEILQAEGLPVPAFASWMADPDLCEAYSKGTLHRKRKITVQGGFA